MEHNVHKYDIELRKNYLERMIGRDLGVALENGNQLMISIDEFMKVESNW
ncbi:hypothetical protein [Candidatus Nitrosocosmicus hydrocola]|nr:hypothetical protein [Candidatus Nitrosocosmicus hydrocola]